MTLSNNTRNNTTPLTIASIADVTATQNGAITDIPVIASGGWGTYTYSISGAPSGISLSNENRITGRPKATGYSDIIVTVQDAVGGEASTTFNLSVSAPTQAMQIASIANVIATQNVAITPIKVKASGGSGSYTYWIGSNRPPASSPLPASSPPTGSGLSIDSSSGRITGTPTASGDFTVTVAVRDGAGSRALPTQVSRPFTMRVRPRVTVSAIGNITVTQNTAITPIQVSASGGQTSYSYSLSSNSATGAGLSINSSSGQITGTPTARGSFTLTVTVTDNASATATESFSMAVSLIGDFNDDGAVNTSDHLLFVAAFGLSEGDDGFNADMDLDGDGTIDSADFLIFVSHFGSSA